MARWFSHSYGNNSYGWAGLVGKRRPLLHSRALMLTVSQDTLVFQEASLLMWCLIFRVSSEWLLCQAWYLGFPYSMATVCQQRERRSCQSSPRSGSQKAQRWLLLPSVVQSEPLDQPTGRRNGFHSRIPKKWPTIFRDDLPDFPQSLPR